MSIEEKSLTDEQKIKKLLEEAAKRHREIEKKIHPSNFSVEIQENNNSAAEKNSLSDEELKALEQGKIPDAKSAEENTIIDDVPENESTPAVVSNLELVKPEEVIKDENAQEVSELERGRINDTISLALDEAEKHAEPVENKSVLEAIENIIARHRKEEGVKTEEPTSEESTILTDKKPNEIEIPEIKEPVVTEYFEPEKSDLEKIFSAETPVIPEPVTEPVELPVAPVLPEENEIKPVAELPPVWEKEPENEHEFEPVTEPISEQELVEEKQDVSEIEETETIASSLLNESESVKDELLKPGEKFITDYDMYLFGQGTHYKIYEKFGAQLTEQNGIKGVCFTTWAPNAKEIYVIGEFNGWQEKDGFKMSRLNDHGIWSAFIPGLKEGDTYKFSIKSWVDDGFRRKADPYAFRSEVRPKNASIVADITKYKWNDIDWINSRGISKFRSEPMNIYEVHLGSWKRDYNNKVFPNEWGYLNYGQLAIEIVEYVKKMGYTHIELLPVMEHPLDISWGYQVTHYYAPTSRFGNPEDLMYFIDYCHQNGIGVILDWVPAHFPYDEHALAYFDGKQIYAYENVKRGIHKDWGTFIFDYGRPEVQNFLIGSALYWLDKYHADGLRVDAVASMLYLDYSRNEGEWEPNSQGGREHLEAIAFLKHLNEKVHEYHPCTVMIAEESTAWPGVSHPVSEGGLGFDMKWNMGWMNDILLYFSKDPIYRKYHQGKITFSLWYAFSENFILPVSHDEVVHGKRSLLEKMPGDNWQKFANLRLFLGFMFGHPGKKLNFMTSDIAQYNEWNCEESIERGLLSLDLNKKLNSYFSDINELYKANRALFEVDFISEGFRWIDFSDSVHSVLSFVRFSADRKDILLFTFNMTPTVHYDYIVGVPEAGFWKEILNSDAEIYGGSGIGNMGGKDSQPAPVKEWQNSIRVTLPPLAVNVYKLERKVSDTKPSAGTRVKHLDEYEQLYVDTDTGGGE